MVCGFIYDEELGLPDEGIAPGTRWDEIPEDWSCPDCGAVSYTHLTLPTILLV